MKKVMLALAALSVGAVGFAGEDDQAKKDLKAIQGTWRPVSQVHDGKRTPEKELKGETLTFTGGDWRREVGGKVLSTGKIKLRPAKSPKEADWHLGGKEVAGFPPNVVIYKIDGDRLDLCFAGKELPTKFESKDGSGSTYTVFERVKKKREKKE